jgi:hypothetical protein
MGVLTMTNLMHFEITYHKPFGNVFVSCFNRKIFVTIQIWRTCFEFIFGLHSFNFMFALTDVTAKRSDPLLAYLEVGIDLFPKTDDSSPEQFWFLWECKPLPENK